QPSQLVAMRALYRQRLFHQDMLARLQGGAANLVMQPVGHDHVNHVDVAARQQRPPVAAHVTVGMRRPSRRLARVALDGDGGKLGARGLGNRRGMMDAKKTIANQAKANRGSGGGGHKEGGGRKFKMRNKFKPKW